jgi:hypothetical protein
VVRRIGRDLRHLHNIDAYAVALIVFVFAVLSVAGDILPANAPWAVLLVGVGVLVFRVTLPDRYEGSADDVLKDRSAFEDKPLPARLREASELWVSAPSAINLLAPQNCDTIRTTLLANPDGVVRVVILDPSAESAPLWTARTEPCRLGQAIPRAASNTEPAPPTCTRPQFHRQRLPGHPLVGRPSHLPYVTTRTHGSAGAPSVGSSWADIGAAGLTG